MATNYETEHPRNGVDGKFIEKQYSPDGLTLQTEPLGEAGSTAATPSGPRIIVVADTLSDYEALTGLNDSVQEFLFGSASDLNANQARAIDELGTHFGMKPSVAVHDAETRVDLIYAPAGDFEGENTTRVTIGGDGTFQSAGSGEFWEDNNYVEDRDDALTDLINARLNG